MKTSAQATLLSCLAIVVAGCGSTATSAPRADSSTTTDVAAAPASGSADAVSPSVPAVSEDRLVQEATAVLKTAPASKALLAKALAAQEPEATPQQVRAALDHLPVNWNTEAVKAAKITIQGSTGTTKVLLADALVSQEHFTRRQAKYAVDHVDVDWNAQAVKGFEHVLKTGHGWSRSGIVAHVVAVDHYTIDLANYAADHANVDWNHQAVKAAKASSAVSRKGIEHALTNSGFTLEQADSAANTLGYFTLAQQNAIDAAQDYLSMEGFSRQGLIDQLDSSYGSGFSTADATFAVDHIKVNWNAQAVRAARSYLDFEPFSRQGLIDQLTSAYGSQFTLAQATYAADRVGL